MLCQVLLGLILKKLYHTQCGEGTSRACLVAYAMYSSKNTLQRFRKTQQPKLTPRDWIFRSVDIVVDGNLGLFVGIRTARFHLFIVVEDSTKRKLLSRRDSPKPPTITSGWRRSKLQRSQCWWRSQPEPRRPCSFRRRGANAWRPKLRLWGCRWNRRSCLSNPPLVLWLCRWLKGRLSLRISNNERLCDEVGSPVCALALDASVDTPHSVQRGLCSCMIPLNWTMGPFLIEGDILDLHTFSLFALASSALTQKES